MRGDGKGADEAALTQGYADGNKSLTDEDLVNAAKSVCTHARDVAEARELLDMLGIAGTVKGIRHHARRLQL